MIILRNKCKRKNFAEGGLMDAVGGIVKPIGDAAGAVMKPVGNIVGAAANVVKGPLETAGSAISTATDILT